MFPSITRRCLTCSGCVAGGGDCIRSLPEWGGGRSGKFGLTGFIGGSGRVSPDDKYSEKYSATSFIFQLYADINILVMPPMPSSVLKSFPRMKFGLDGSMFILRD